MTNPLLDMQRNETNELLKYVDEGKESWRFAGFVCSLLLVLVSLLSVFVNILQVTLQTYRRLRNYCFFRADIAFFHHSTFFLGIGTCNLSARYLCFYTSSFPV